MVSRVRGGGLLVDEKYPHNGIAIFNFALDCSTDSLSQTCIARAFEPLQSPSVEVCCA